MVLYDFDIAVYSDGDVFLPKNVPCPCAGPAPGAAAGVHTQRRVRRGGGDAARRRILGLVKK